MRGLGMARGVGAAGQGLRSLRGACTDFRPMPTTSDYAPDPKLKFTFGLWTVGNVGAGSFWRADAGEADSVGVAGAFGGRCEGLWGEFSR